LRETLALAPPSATIAFAQTGPFPNARARSYRLGPGYVANDVEIHADIVSEHVGSVSANKSPNDKDERHAAAMPSIEAA